MAKMLLLNHKHIISETRIQSLRCSSRGWGQPSARPGAASKLLLDFSAAGLLGTMPHTKCVAQLRISCHMFYHSFVLCISVLCRFACYVSIKAGAKVTFGETDPTTALKIGEFRIKDLWDYGGSHSVQCRVLSWRRHCTSLILSGEVSQTLWTAGTWASTSTEEAATQQGRSVACLTVGSGLVGPSATKRLEIVLITQERWLLM